MLNSFHKTIWDHIQSSSFDQALINIGEEYNELTEKGEDIETLSDILKNIYNTDDKLKDMVFDNLKSTSRKEGYIASYSN